MSNVPNAPGDAYPAPFGETFQYNGGRIPDGYVLTWDATAKQWVPKSGGGGTSGQIFKATALTSGFGPTDGGGQTECIIQEGSVNVMSCCSTLNTIGAAGMISGLTITGPVFSAGTLVIAYAELDVSNATGTEKLAYGTSTPISMTTGWSNPVRLADFDGGILEQIGTDLTMDSGGHIISTAGGQFAVSCAVNLTATGLKP